MWQVVLGRVSTRQNIMPCEQSVSQWIVGAQKGDSRAIGALWQCYFERLVRLARGKLAGVSRRAADEEDLALSAFASFCHAAKAGRIPDLADRDGLWRLLIKLTAQKAVDRRRHEGCAKRGGGRVRGESAMAHRGASDGDEGLDQIIGDAPTPEFAAIVAEQCSRLLDSLNDELRPLALAKMEGYTNEELVGRFDCSLSTVERRLRLIRKIWQQEMDR
jgi:DNA-directed RNA polymerase specialized sigma24 family protein